MPFWRRMQNFMFTPEGVVWTSATKSPLQRLTKRGDYCTVSNGYTIPHHGQTVRYEDGKLIWFGLPNDEHYDIRIGEFLGKFPGTSLLFRDLKKLSPSNMQQGVAYRDGVGKSVCFGKSGKGDIEVYDIKTKARIDVSYSKLKKWYWRHWEAEGLQYDPMGNLWVGIDVVTIFGTHLSYRHLVK